MSDKAWRFFCAVLSHAPILNNEALAHQVIDALHTTADKQRAMLWGYVVLPDSVQFAVETASEGDYHRYVEAFKTASEPSLIATIQAHHEQLIDAITFYHPMWNKPTYTLWKEGYHTKLLASAYALSNKVANLVYKPVEMDLVTHPSAWPFSSYQAEEDL